MDEQTTLGEFKPPANPTQGNPSYSGTGELVDDRKPIMPWQAAVKRSTIPRINWKKILGMTLTKYVAEGMAQKMTRAQLTDAIILKGVGDQELSKHGWEPEKIAENVRIGVSARMAEMKSEKTAYKTKKAELMTWTARIIRTSNGSRIVGVAKEVQIADGKRVELTIREVE